MKRIGLFIVMAIAVLFLMGCVTTEMSSNKVGWSDYVSITVKDFDVLGVINLKSEVIQKVGPFGFKKTNEGSEITYAMLMEEAVKLKGDDIINVRIDKKTEQSQHIFSHFTGYTNIFTYTATALVIKYKDATADVKTSEFKQEIKEPQEHPFSLFSSQYYQQPYLF